MLNIFYYIKYNNPYRFFSYFFFCNAYFCKGSFLQIVTYEIALVYGKKQDIRLTEYVAKGGYLTRYRIDILIYGYPVHTTIYLRSRKDGQPKVELRSRKKGLDSV